jgi:hypothetical protein
VDVSDVIARARPVKTPWALAGRVDRRLDPPPIPPRNVDAGMLFARHFDRHGR